MKIPKLAQIFGANYKTMLTGIGAAFFTMLTLISGLSYQLGEMALIIPPQWKSTVFTASIIAAFVLRVWNSIVQKDKNVTGGTMQQTASGAPAAKGTQDLVDLTVVATKESGEKVPEGLQPVPPPN